jgi:hypothetical protein
MKHINSLCEIDMEFLRPLEHKLTIDVLMFRNVEFAWYILALQWLDLTGFSNIPTTNN